MQKKILLCSDDHEFREYIAVLLEADLPFDVIEKDATNLFDDEDIFKEVFLIITDWDLLIGTGKSLYRYNVNVSKIPFLSIHPSDIETGSDYFKRFFADIPQNRIIAKALVPRSIVKEVDSLAKYYEVEIGPNAHFEDFDGVKMFRMKIDILLRKDVVDGNTFVKLKSGRFIKVLNSGDEVNKDVLENIKGKGQNYVYQDADTFHSFVKESFSTLIGALSNKNLDKATKMKLQLKTIKEVQDTVRLMGISEVVIDATDQVVSSVEELLKSKHNLRGMVKNLLKYKSTFFTRSSILNYIIGGIANEMGWDTRSSMKKLVFASVFCDFAFEDNQDHLAVILSRTDEAYTKLSRADKKIVDHHGERAARKLEAQAGIMIDEKTIVRLHHEKPDGSGFPRGLNYSKIPAMSCAFILAYDYTQKLVESCSDPKDIRPGAVLESLGPSYAKGNFQKPYMALRKALQLDIIQEK